ncbi:MAG: hypothetical protein KKD39_08495 [Candidatus Altiarchaeota archaeon]|nr:hypothetical protein [Candidatus Altiarchaeota archaeon]
MTDLGEYDVKLEGELTSDHLFALLCELRSITAREAERKLKVGLENIRVWSEELRNKGLVEIDVLESGDFRIKITAGGLKKFEELEGLWQMEQTPVKIEKKKKTPYQFRRLKNKIRKVGVSVKDEVKRNPALYVSLLISIYLLKIFLTNPNREALNFLLGSLCLSIFMVAYSRKHKNTAPQMMVKNLMSWVRLSYKKTKKLMLLFLAAMGLVYSAGMIFVQPDAVGFYVMLVVFFASTVEIIYFPRKTSAMIFKFYLGTLLMAGGIVLIIGLISLSRLTLGERVYYLDFIFGLGMLVLAYINDNVLHVSQILDKTKVDKIESLNKPNP